MSSDCETLADPIPIALSPISTPLVNDKLKESVSKMIKKAAKGKMLKRGVKETVKAIRKGSKGIVILAGDIHPIDVISHIPLLCEEATIPYLYVHSKVELGTAALTKRATSCIMVLPPKSDSDHRKYYEKCQKEIASLA